MIRKPDFDTAAIKASEILLQNHITETPIHPIRFLRDWDGVRVVPFTRMAMDAGIERNDLVPMFGANQDAATFHLNMPGMEDVKYVVFYNMRLPYEIIDRGIAREFGHIVLGHDGSTRTPEARLMEAMCFAHHLLSPRPIIHLMQQSGMPVTMSMLAQTTGCSEECVEDMQMIPGAHVPKELNIRIRDAFAPHINEYLRFHVASPMLDKSPVLDFGTFMDFYEE